MQKLTVICSEAFGTYNSLEGPEQPIGYLELYLNDIPLKAISSEIQWALNAEHINKATNNMWLEKKGNNILIHWNYTDIESEVQYYEIIISEFVKVLTEWEKLVRAKTKKITITQNDDGNMAIEGE